MRTVPLCAAPFCRFIPERRRTLGHEYDEVRECMLGWDITDYGMGDFNRLGFSLVTIRNGNRALAEKYPKVYAEKLLYRKEGQYAPPTTFTGIKPRTSSTGGREHADPGVQLSAGRGDRLRFQRYRPYRWAYRYSPSRDAGAPDPGESIHIQQRLYHDFTVEEGTGPVLLGEVSQCNDENTDNRFNPPMGRFPEIEEDEPPYCLPCNEYPPGRFGLGWRLLGSV